MPLTRYQIRNEYSLADPELYRAADKDDPEALLEGVAMAGLVGLLRQLGDLAEFAAEIFHDLHEEVMATAARGHGLTLRVQQLEADFPAMESAFLSQINHSIFLHNSGVDWHPNLRLDGSLVTQGDLPRFVMHSYEECRGPPRLFLLDKFDIAGAGACLKRYTDPSFFKAEFTAAEVAKEKLKRENKAFKVKKKPSRWRNGDNPEATASNSNRRLHELLLEERCQSENNVHTHHVKLKRRHSTNSLVDSTSGKSYMERFINKHSPDSKFVCESSAISSRSKTRSIDISGLMSEREIHEMSSNELVTRERSLVSSHSKDQMVPRASLDEFDVDVVEERNPKKLFESGPAIELENIPSSFFKVENKEELVVDTTGNAEATIDGYHSDDVNSELENYTDALTTMDSEIETDTESKPKNERGFKIGRKSGEFETNEEQKDIQAHFSDSQSIGSSVVSEDGNDSLQKSRFISSYPDIFCNTVENISSDGDLAAKEQPSAENGDTRNVSDSPSHSRDNSLSVRSHKGDTRRTLNKINRNASHENFIHLSNGVGSVEEGKDVDVDINETLPVGVAVDKHDENQTNVKIDSPDSVLVNSETELNDLVQGDVEARLGTQWAPTCGPESPTDADMNDQRSDGTFVDLREVMSSGKKEYLTSVVDCPEIDDFREQKELKIIDQAPLLELDKAEVGIGDSAVEAAGNTLESSETSYFGVIETSSSSDISHELPFTCTTSDATKLVSAAEAPLEVVYAETTNLCSEGVEDIVMHNSLIGCNNADLNQDMLETAEACDVNILTRSNGNKVVEYNPIAASSDCIDQLCNQEKSYPSSHEFLADVHDPLMVDRTEMHLDITEDTEVPSSMKERDQSKELRQPLPSFVAVNVEALSTHLAEAEVLREGQEYEHAESPNHMYYDECSTAPPKSSSMDFGSQPADLNLFSPITSYEFERPEPSVHPLETISQGLALHPDTTNQPLLDTQPHRPILAVSLPDDNVMQDSVEEKPPLPPLPPMQWRTGKLQSPTSGEDTTLPSFSKSSLLSADTTECMAEESYPSSRGSYAQPLNPFLPHPTSDTENPQHDFQMLGSDVVQPSLIPSSLLVPAVEYPNFRSDLSLDSTITKPLNPFLPLIDEDLQHGSSNSEEEVLQHNSLNQFTPGSPTEDSSTRSVSLNLQEEREQSADSLTTLKCGEDDKLRPQISTTPPTMESEKDGHESQTLEGELKWQSNSLSVVPTIDYGKPNGSIKSRLPRPRDPLIEAVASHDKSNLRKVTERIIHQSRPEVDERNSLLEQIRTKSFNLKPAVATRPSIHGPKTNLKVVAILEKANAIRQALAGSDDDDDDEDSWSDS
ncbi:Scar2 [Thalictrum thalictroides]|uniref:Protein SCAR n=1 Tax=Thalictrum thalictroides TaxID=46969 RepID=A0A7J6VRF6_THATH|nr:Scar2 [Thalictrum thalictroides]